jgi:hypothetical protein
LPPATPSTIQVALPPPGTVAVYCCVSEMVRADVAGVSVIVVFDTVTAAVDMGLVPPLPVQTSE